MKRQHINIAIIGAVSVGKSTLLNTLFIEKYSEMRKKRTTMLPQVYQETKNKQDEKILENNDKINKEFVEKTENGGKLEVKDCKEVFYQVKKIVNFHDLEEDVYLDIYDIPGLNDARTKTVYFDYLKNNFYKFDIVIFMVDIESSINTSDEVEILDKITEYISNSIKINKQIHLITLVNKCDNLTYTDGEPNFNDDEMQEQFNQVKKTIQDTCIKKNIKKLSENIIPINMEESYIYRICRYDKSAKLDKKHIDKIGLNEYGKKWHKMENKNSSDVLKLINSNYNTNIDNCGFGIFQDILNEILTKKNQYEMLVNKLIDSVRIINSDKNDVNAYTGYININDEHKALNKKFDSKNKFTFLESSVTNRITFNIATISSFSIINTLNEYMSAFNLLILFNDYIIKINKSLSLIDETELFKKINNLKYSLINYLESTMNAQKIIEQVEFIKTLEHLVKISQLKVFIKILIEKNINKTVATPILFKYINEIVNDDIDWNIKLIVSYLENKVAKEKNVLYLIQLQEFLQRKMAYSLSIYLQYFKKLNIILMITLNSSSPYSIQELITKINNNIDELELENYLDEYINNGSPKKTSAILIKK